jgi:gluconolactonase
MKNNIKIFAPDRNSPFADNSVVKKLASGFKFAEGPLWHPAGYLLFSDIPANRIFSIYLNQVMHVLLHHSGGQHIIHTHLSDMIGSNGLALDKQRNLIFCQHGNHGIAKMDKKKNITQLCCSFNGKPFNSPNDLVVKSDDAIFFTDPPYGLKNQVLNPDIFQPHSGVYRFHKNSVTLLTSELTYPNGICFSPDEQYLFISSNHPDEKLILRYEISNNGNLFNKTVFATINADGIKTDRYNNLYAATKDGVIILSPHGEKTGVIELPEIPTNLTFGGHNNDMLFITTASSLYYVQLQNVNEAETTVHLKAEKRLRSIEPAVRHADGSIMSN